MTGIHRQPVLIPDPLVNQRENSAMDRGSVSTGYSDRPVARAIKIKHAGLNLTGRRKDIMNRQKILVQHWRWLEARGYKEQAASCKLQAESLTRNNYRIIKEICKQKTL